MSLWDWLTTSRHTRWLEAEIARLREDRDEARRQAWALMNSLVTTAGAPLPQEILRQAAAQAAAGRGPLPKLPVPRGKPTWHQRAVALELESVREMQRQMRSEASKPSEPPAQ